MNLLPGTAKNSSAAAARKWRRDRFPLRRQRNSSSGCPRFLDQLVDALRNHLSSNSEISRSAARHGHDLQLQGFTVSQVVHDYGDVCQSITDLALRLNAPISVEDFRTLNRCLDDAIASAVTEYGRGHQSLLDANAARDDERLGFLEHEIRNLVGTASVAFEVLRTGNVGVGGSTGGVLQRSLSALRDLINRSLGERRMRHDIRDRSQFGIGEFIAELAPAAALEARARGLVLNVVEGDPERASTRTERFWPRPWGICCRMPSSSPDPGRP